MGIAAAAPHALLRPHERQAVGQESPEVLRIDGRLNRYPAFVALARAQEIVLFPGLDAFGDDEPLEGPCDVDDAIKIRRRRGRVPPPHEALIDLTASMELLQVADRVRVSAAEVIDGDRDADRRGAGSGHRR